MRTWFVDLDSGLPHQKPTGFLTASAGWCEGESFKAMQWTSSASALRRRTEDEESSGVDTTALQGYAGWIVRRGR